MKLADYYINEKALIHKLFKVVVPRFETSQLTFGSYTRMYRLRPLSDGLTPGHGRERSDLCTLLAILANQSLKLTNLLGDCPSPLPLAPFTKYNVSIYNKWV